MMGQPDKKGQWPLNLSLGFPRSSNGRGCGGRDNNGSLLSLLGLCLFRRDLEDSFHLLNTVFTFHLHSPVHFLHC